MITKALSIRAPWWFILHGGKDIENRDRPTSFRGTVYVHASKFWTEQVGTDIVAGESLRCQGIVLTEEIAAMCEARGCIVGMVDIVDCVRESKSPWFFGDYGFVLANPVAFAKPVPCKGALGFFTASRMTCWRNWSVPSDSICQRKGPQDQPTGKAETLWCLPLWGHTG